MFECTGNMNHNTVVYLPISFLHHRACQIVTHWPNTRNQNSHTLTKYKESKYPPISRLQSRYSNNYALDILKNSPIKFHKIYANLLLYIPNIYICWIKFTKSTPKNAYYQIITTKIRYFLAKIYLNKVSTLK